MGCANQRNMTLNVEHKTKYDLSKKVLPTMAYIPTYVCNMVQNCMPTCIDKKYFQSILTSVYVVFFMF